MSPVSRRHVILKAMKSKKAMKPMKSKATLVFDFGSASVFLKKTDPKFRVVVLHPRRSHFCFARSRSRSPMSIHSVIAFVLAARRGRRCQSESKINIEIKPV